MMKPMISEPSPGVFRWQSLETGPHQPVNTYLVPLPEGLIVIDPASDLTAGIISASGLPPVKGILLTHVQEEHAAGCVNFADVPVWVPEGDQYLCHGIDAYSKSLSKWQSPWDWEGRGNYKGQMAGAANERPPRHPLRLAGTVRDGDTIFNLKVLGTGGHGKSAVTYLLDTHNGVLAFCGDLVCGSDGRMWNWFDCEWDYGCNTGQKSLLSSARKLLVAAAGKLFPTHGEPIANPNASIGSLIFKLAQILEKPVRQEIPFPVPLTFPDNDSPAQGFREISRHLHQLRTGNLSVILSDSGNALFVDDGLCNWIQPFHRSEAHREIIGNLKRSLGVKKVEIVIPTHYHGDHTENIPDIVSMEKAKVISLDIAAGPMVHPEMFNLACLLPWYGSSYDVIKVDQCVRSGYRLKWHEYELEIFHLGGQTNYHAGISVMIDGRKVVFTGDSCFPGSDDCDEVICWNDSEPFSKGYAFAVEGLIERNPDLLVSAHGMAQIDPMPFLLRKREAWRNMGELYRSLSARSSLQEFFTPDILKEKSVKFISRK